MHAWFCENPTGPEALKWAQCPTPEPSIGQVLVQIHAASLNFPDWLIIHGQYQLKPKPPFVPGAEYAGTVLAVGPEVTTLYPGQRVACVTGTGGFSTHALAPAQLCFPLPEALPFSQAAVFTMMYATAYHALIDRGQLQAGESVLILGAAGGVGAAAIQIAKNAGAHVIAAASSDEKCAFCRSLGADVTINYQTEDLRNAIRSHTRGNGPHVVYDPVGGSFSETALRTIAWRGRYLVVGFAAGTIPALSWNLPLLKGASIVGVYWGSFAQNEPQANARMLQLLAQSIIDGRITPPIDQVLPMTKLMDALSAMSTRRVRGKLVLVNESSEAPC